MSKSLTSVTIDTNILEEARRMRVNISEAAENGIATATGQSKKFKGKADESESKYATVDMVLNDKEKSELIASMSDKEKQTRRATGWQRFIRHHTGHKLTTGEIIAYSERLKTQGRKA